MAPDNPAEPPSGQYEEEGFGLRKHMLVLAAEWRKIALGAISFAGAAGALMWALWTFLPKYEASADAAIIRATPRVSIDETLSTGMVDSRRVSYRDRIAERAAFVGLVHNGDVARAVMERLGGQLDEDENEFTLLDGIDAELVTIGVQSEANNSDLIRITASAGAPGKAMNFANAWVEEYVKVVNRIYEKAPASLLAAVNAEIERTRKRYEVAQEALETIISQSRSSQLEREIEIRAGLVQNWATAQNEALAADYNLMLRMASQLGAARLARAQIGNAGETNTGSNGLGLLLLKAEAYTSAPQTVQLELEGDFDTAGATQADPADQSADVEALIAALEERIENVRQSILRRYQFEFLASRALRQGAARSELGRITDSRARSDGTSAAGAPSAPDRRQPVAEVIDLENISLSELVTVMESEIRTIKRDKEKEDRILSEATKRRDLLRSSLDSLENEIVELTLVKASAISTEVRLASLAVPPELPAGPHPILAAAFGGFAGLLAMVCFVLLMRPADARPPVSR